MLLFVVVEPTTANSNNVGQFCVKSCVNNRFSFSPFLTSLVTLSTLTFTGCCQPGTLFQVIFLDLLKRKKRKKFIAIFSNLCYCKSGESYEILFRVHFTDHWRQLCLIYEYLRARHCF